MNKLHTLYRQILTFAGFEVEKDDTLHIYLDGKDYPADIDGKKIKFPTDEALRAFDAEREVIFHPLQEFVGRGESDIVRKLRRILNVRLNLATLFVIDGLMDILSNQATHSKMNPEQRELLRSVSVVDGTLRAKFNSIAVSAFSESPDSLFVNMYLKKSGVYRGEKHARVGIVSFPIYSSEFSATKKFKKDEWETVLQIMRFVFPDSETDPEAYNNFSDSNDCAWLSCLLNTSAGLAERINTLQDLYKEFLNPDNLIEFNMDWVDGFNNLEQYRKEIMMIPSQRGNEGVNEAVKAEAPVETSKPTVTINPGALATPAARPAPTPSPAPAPVIQPAPTPASSIYGDAVRPLASQYPNAPVNHPGSRQITKNADGKVNLDDLVVSPPSPMYPNPGFNSPIAHAAQAAQMAAIQAAMMHSPSMAAAMGYQMPVGVYPQQNFHHPQMHGVQQGIAGYDNFGRPIDMYGRVIGAGVQVI